MSSGIKSADRDMTGPSKSKGGGGMSMQRNWMGCGHNHTQGTLRNGIPWLCAACIKASLTTAETVAGSITNQHRSAD